ncbi:RAP domain-containing protein [Cardiosporidium cionae]|uniref:RAP domain-containing protein n=1 Tax=Cardiosporidium cionae TaxID=476202 RepID=A0ABQ7JDJ1_9APIC|nr:RAP domain-containing protein [Cardiosporidium cionae]|eukprot:KAF8822034.1 RAP domain-containing protein [Cardiosporidium cionae]
MTGLHFFRVQLECLLTSFSSFSSQSPHMTLRYFSSSAAVSLRRCLSTSECLCSVYPKNFTTPSFRVEKSRGNAIRYNYTPCCCSLSHFTRNGNDCSKRFFSSIEPTVQRTAEEENSLERSTPNQTIGEINEKYCHEECSEQAPAHSACSSSPSDGSLEEGGLPVIDLAIRPMVTVETDSCSSSPELSMIAVGKDTSLNFPCQAPIVSEGNEPLDGSDNAGRVITRSTPTNSSGDILKNETLAVNHGEPIANNDLNVLSTHNSAHMEPQANSLHTMEVPVSTKEIKENNATSLFNEKVAPVEGRPLVFDGDIEVLSPEQQKQKEELIKELTKRLSGPLADENGKIPTGKDRPTAIEVDGPSHFYANSTRYTAYTKLKHRLLTRMGYRVLHVPYFEWRKLRSAADREEYMRTKLLEEPTEWLDPEDAIFYKKRLEALEKQQRIGEEMVLADSKVEKEFNSVNVKQDRKAMQDIEVNDHARISADSLGPASRSETENTTKNYSIALEKRRVHKEAISGIENLASAKESHEDVPLIATEFRRNDYSEAMSSNSAQPQDFSEESYFHKKGLQHDRSLQYHSSTASTKRPRKQTLKNPDGSPCLNRSTNSVTASVDKYSTTKDFTNGYMPRTAPHSSGYTPAVTNRPPFQNHDSAQYQYNSSESSPSFKQTSESDYNYENNAYTSYDPRRQDHSHMEGMKGIPTSNRPSPLMTHQTPSHPSPQGHHPPLAHNQHHPYVSPYGGPPPPAFYDSSSQHFPGSHPPSQQRSQQPPRSVPYGQQHPLPHSTSTHQNQPFPPSDSLPTSTYGQQSYQSSIPPYNQMNVPPPPYDPRFQNYGVSSAYAPPYDPNAAHTSYPRYPPHHSYFYNRSSPHSLPGTFPQQNPSSPHPGYSENWQHTGAPTISESRNAYPEIRREEHSLPHKKNRVQGKARRPSSGLPPSGISTDTSSNTFSHYEAPFAYNQADFSYPHSAVYNDTEIQRQRPGTMLSAKDEPTPNNRVKQQRRARKESSAMGGSPDFRFEESVPLTPHSVHSSETVMNEAPAFENPLQKHLKGKKRK